MLCLWWRVGLTAFHEGETESQERLGASQAQGEAVHPSVSCSVGRAPSFFHRHHLLMQPLLFKLRSFEVFLPGLFSSRQDFLRNYLQTEKLLLHPAGDGCTWTHVRLLALTSVKFGSSPSNCSSLCGREQPHTKGSCLEPFLKW